MISKGDVEMCPKRISKVRVQNNNGIKSIYKVETREVLVANEKFKMICFIFEKDKGLPNHTHNGLAAIQVLEGRVEMNFVNGKNYLLKEGDVLSFDAHIEHNVIAKEKSKVIVTIIK